MWVPPQHVIDSESDPDEEGDDAEDAGDEEEGAGEDEEEEEADGDDDDEMEEPAPVPERIHKRKAVDAPRLKKLHKHVTKAKRGAPKR